jgi:hypothetical protein
MSDMRLFKDRNLLIATKHKKELVMTPLLEKALGVRCITDSSLDTDILGTFTGEIERKDDPLTTVRNKCLMAAEVTNCDLIVASEGSFFPHSLFQYSYVNVEILCFMDLKNHLEIIVYEQSHETNFNGQTVKSLTELEDFCRKVGFPSHGLILRRSQNDHVGIIKGIQTNEQLISYYNYFVDTYGEVFIETDMRAMFNPTRQKVIKRATEALLKKISNLCPSCSTPGYGIIESLRGLPCEICDNPTTSIKSHIYLCQKCSYTENVDYPNGKKIEDAMYCDMCNP